jgi:uncharacterized membrane protein YeiH
MVAIRKKLDLLGIVVLGVITAVGGGMIRDIMIGINPPTLFLKPIYVTTAFISVLLLFMIIKFGGIKISILESEIYESVMNLFDAIGLGAFTVVGIDTALAAGFRDYAFLSIFLGVITGVGGGLLRDIMADVTPAVLKKHIYACASIAGAVCYMLLLDVVNDGVRVVISSSLVVIIRLLARKYKWNLPKAM